MTSNNVSISKGLVLATGMLCLTFAAPGGAQVQTQTTTASGAPTHDVMVESGEVVAVNGNNLFVKMDDGTLRDFPNVPESARVMVDGKQLGIHDLRPGMKLQRTTVRTTTPQMVTTVQTVTGKVFHVTPPVSVVLTLENGQNQAFKIPPGQKFTVNGRQTDAFGLRKGMIVSATKIVETPVNSVTQHAQVTGTMPVTLPADEPVLIVKGPATPAPSTAEPAAATEEAAATTSQAPQLPKTASYAPLIGLLGLFSLSAAFGVGLLRKHQS